MPKFVPRQRKHKARAREAEAQNKPNAADGDAVAAEDSNALEILPASKRDREEKRERLREELRASQPKVSGKKKKRLEKYIDTKLKKEENLELLKKLASHKVDTSLFQSSKKLGRTTETKREVLSRALRERAAGIDVEKNEGILLESRKEPQFAPAPENESDDSEQEEQEKQEEEKPALNGLFAVTPAASVLGSGLKRPLEVDEEGKPVIKKRKRTKTKSFGIQAPVELEWEGFSSENDNGEKSADDESDEADSDEQDESGFEEDEEEDDSSGSEEEDEDEDESEEDESSEDDTSKAKRKERVSAFKAWATQQKNEVIGFTPTTVIEEASKAVNFVPRAPEQEPLPPELETKTATDATRKAYAVAVERSPEIQEARLNLPVVAEEQKIMEAIHNNDVVVVWGATGSGKTTQVPQFLFEAGYGDPKGPTPGMIGVTQPRRVAAVSMSKRVGQELGDQESRVGHQIRFDTTVSSNTAIKFMTDGVLLREIAMDFALTKYSAIVIDEAHERSVNTDILIGMLSRIVDLRATMAKEEPEKNKPLKLIIMSATLRISDFTDNQRLFRKGPPPLLQAEGRQYPVTIHFARRTQRDYVEEAFRKVSRGHKKLPPGGMLVFLTGQNEISHLAKRLKEAFASTQGKDPKTPPVRISAAESTIEAEDIDIGDTPDDFGNSNDWESGSDISGLEDEEDKEFDIGEESVEDNTMKVHVLPLYSQLPTNQQLRVFQPPPEGSRLIVLATNVAETSLTIPGIRYVFDCGRAKEKKFDGATGVQSFEIGWISKASASQRAGRAGRTGPGHCYRLYSSAVFERDFEEYAEPEILRTPIEGLVLQLKSMNLHHVINFPFPTPPDRQALAKAEKLLSYLGALTSDGKITKIGRELSLYPLNPRFARMLVLGQQHNLTAYTIALVAALAVPDIFIPENQLDLSDPVPAADAVRTEADNLESTARAQRRRAYNKAHASFTADAQSDALKLLTALCAYAYNPTSDFCDRNFLRHKALQEASQLREQLHSLMRTHSRSGSSTGPYTARLPPLKDQKNRDALRLICAAGFVDQVAIRADFAPVPPSAEETGGRKPRRAIEVPYLPLLPAHADVAEGKYVYLHPSSMLSATRPEKMPLYICYAHLQRASSASTSAAAPKTRMQALTPLTTAQLAHLAAKTPLVRFSKPVAGKAIEGLERREGRERRRCTVGVSLEGEGGGTGWSLGTREVVQVKGPRGEWVVED